MTEFKSDGTKERVLTEIAFRPWPKTPRLNRDIVITEKIDGTNAAVQIIPVGGDTLPVTHQATYTKSTDYQGFLVVAQSRKRIITPESDNAGFARWVYDNADTLADDLGPGTHFGEWWGAGIQRRYGQTEKWFSLFNTAKWHGAKFVTSNLRSVPILYEGRNSAYEVAESLEFLRDFGSVAASELGQYNQKAEGIIVFHTAANMVFKVTLEDDESPKSLVT